MYSCEEHGLLDSEWCGDCGKVVECDHLPLKTSKVKDIHYLLDDGTEMTVTIYIEHCPTCGKLFGASL